LPDGLFPGISSQAWPSKIFRFFRNEISSIVVPSRSTRGALAIVTNVGGGMRWTLAHRLTRDGLADGEIVWSRSPDAGIKLQATLRATEANKPALRGERV
jgi:hypothetical protein